MTKKDYDLIAKSIKKAIILSQTNRMTFIHYLMAELELNLKDDNKRFDIDEFLKACNYK